MNLECGFGLGYCWVLGEWIQWWKGIGMASSVRTPEARSLASGFGIDVYEC